MVEFYKCMHCGQIVTKVNDIGVNVVCCGEAMKLLKANTIVSDSVDELDNNSILDTPIDEEGNPVEKKPASKKSAPKQAPAKAPAMNPVDNSGSNISRFDADYIRSLDPASPEYAEFRKSLGLK